MNYDFSDQIQQITKRTRARLENVAEKIALEIARRIIMATPVDTGALRGNWFPSYETPDVSYDEGLKDPSGTATVAKIVGSINGHKMVGKIWYMTNSLPYAYRVEYEGWSRMKAPAGMVRVSVASYHQALTEALR